jgi:hypothetical protein
LEMGFCKLFTWTDLKTLFPPILASRVVRITGESHIPGSASFWDGGGLHNFFLRLALNSDLPISISCYDLFETLEILIYKTSQEEDGGGDLTNVQCKATGNCTMNPPVRWICASKRNQSRGRTREKKSINTHLMETSKRVRKSRCHFLRRSKMQR